MVDKHIMAQKLGGFDIALSVQGAVFFGIYLRQLDSGFATECITVKQFDLYNLFLHLFCISVMHNCWNKKVFTIIIMFYETCQEQTKIKIIDLCNALKKQTNPKAYVACSAFNGLCYVRAYQLLYGIFIMQINVQSRKGYINVYVCIL